MQTQHEVTSGTFAKSYGKKPAYWEAEVVEALSQFTTGGTQVLLVTSS